MKLIFKIFHISKKSVPNTKQKHPIKNRNRVPHKKHIQIFFKIINGMFIVFNCSLRGNKIDEFAAKLVDTFTNFPKTQILITFRPVFGMPPSVSNLSSAEYLLILLKGFLSYTFFIHNTVSIKDSVQTLNELGLFLILSLTKNLNKNNIV